MQNIHINNMSDQIKLIGGKSSHGVSIGEGQNKNDNGLTKLTYSIIIIINQHHQHNFCELSPLQSSLSLSDYHSAVSNHYRPDIYWMVDLHRNGLIPGSPHNWRHRLHELEALLLLLLLSMPEEVGKRGCQPDLWRLLLL